MRSSTPSRASSSAAGVSPCKAEGGSSSTSGKVGRGGGNAVSNSCGARSLRRSTVSRAGREKRCQRAFIGGSSSTPVAPISKPSTANTQVGKPGTSANSRHRPPATISTRGLAASWRAIASPRWRSRSSPVARVTIRPAAIADNSAGICATMPSPMVRTEYFTIACAIGMPCCMTPTARPPSRLMTMMTMPQIASPLTNFIAPSRLPWSLLSSSSSRRLRRASSLSIRPERRSESIDSCLPGMASSEKRAETSATRSAPFAMTMNWTTVMIRNTTMPTTRLPPATSRPKVSMMWPAWPSSRISLVVAIDTARRNSVVINSTLGNTENSSGDAT